MNNKVFQIPFARKTLLFWRSLENKLFKYRDLIKQLKAIELLSTLMSQNE